MNIWRKLLSWPLVTEYLQTISITEQIKAKTISYINEAEILLTNEIKRNKFTKHTDSSDLRLAFLEDQYKSLLQYQLAYRKYSKRTKETKFQDSNHDIDDSLTESDLKAVFNTDCLWFPSPISLTDPYILAPTVVEVIHRCMLSAFGLA